VLKIVYVSAGPIQNTLPYEIMYKQEDIQSLVIYLDELQSSKYIGSENITKLAYQSLTHRKYEKVVLKQKAKNITGMGFFDFRSNGIFKYLKGKKVIIVYGHYLFVYWQVIIYGLLARKKIILTTDAVEIKGSAYSNPRILFLKKYFLKLLYNYLSDGVFVPSAKSKNYLQSIGIKHEKICITPYVVDEQIFTNLQEHTLRILREKYTINEDDFVFLFCAKFIERKEPLLLLSCFSKLSRDKVKLVMIGDGPLIEEMRGYIESQQLEQSVILPGIVSYAELPYYYKMASVTVVPSSHEPYGLPVNESLLVGTPVITSSAVGAALDLIDENKTGWIFDNKNADSLLTIMTDVTYNRNRVKLMENSCIEKMKTWSSTTNVENQIAFFRKRKWTNAGTSF